MAIVNNLVPIKAYRSHNSLDCPPSAEEQGLVAEPADYTDIRVEGRDL